ncbi:hypothetical protein AAZX31_19G127600 [Glycine max]
MMECHRMILLHTLQCLVFLKEHLLICSFLSSTMSFFFLGKFNYVFNKPCSLYMVIIMYQHNKQKRRIKGICLVRSQGSLNLEDNLQLLFTLSLRFFHMDEVG